MTELQSWKKNRQFFKAILLENQQTIWFSLPGEVTKTLSTKYNKVFQLYEKFLTMVGNSWHDK